MPKEREALKLEKLALSKITIIDDERQALAPMNAALTPKPTGGTKIIVGVITFLVSVLITADVQTKPYFRAIGYLKSLGDNSMRSALLIKQLCNKILKAE